MARIHLMTKFLSWSHFLNTLFYHYYPFHNIYYRYFLYIDFSDQLFATFFFNAYCLKTFYVQISVLESVNFVANILVIGILEYLCTSTK